jgi:phytoene dehydrogenase-like protein
LEGPEQTSMNVPAQKAVVIGAGPNGLAAAIELARAGYAVSVYEASETIGGGVRSAEITLPGYVHDLCSTAHPLAASSPFFATLPLAQHGVELIHSPAALAHPFDDGTAVLLQRSLEATAAELGADANAYRRLFAPFVRDWQQLAPALLGPLRVTRHPFKLGRFGFYGLRSAAGLAQSLFRTERARALFAGLAAHSFLSLDQLATAAFGLVLGTLGHVGGWPVIRGGSQKLADALGSCLQELGGEIHTNTRIRSLAELPAANVVMCDVTPRQLLALAGDKLSPGFQRRLRHYRYGPAAFKVDWALHGPVPWKASECRQAATIHLGGSLSELIASEAAPWKGTHSESPFLIVCQASLFDDRRAPAGQHTLWAYCHVPHGSNVDMTERIEGQIERFAPGFREQILARSVMSPAQLEERNPNLVGGDINGGVQDLRQLFTRPTIRTYSTPLKWLYLCSSSTPPGGGVHGMCGYHAARTALRSQ